MPHEFDSASNGGSESDRDGEMPWETAAREAIQAATVNAAFDEVRGAIYLMSSENNRVSTIQKEFRYRETLQDRLVKIGEEAWLSYVPFDGGLAVFKPRVDGWVE